MSRASIDLAIQPAPAKINLYLHVGAPGADGYHPLSSLVVFGGATDQLKREPAPAFSFHAEGRFSSAMGPGRDNLVVRAVEALASAADAPMPDARLTLVKAIPVAAGLGGGSSDAAAALRLFAGDYPRLTAGEIEAVAARLGADVPMCLHGRPAIAEGRGERLTAAPPLPNLYGVLVNPGVASPTSEVFRAYDADGRFGGEARGILRPGYEGVRGFVADLAACRNDLEPVARRLFPAVDACLADLAARPQVLLARLSGSGGTCFALCADKADADRLADDLLGDRPGWWVKELAIRSDRR